MKYVIQRLIHHLNNNHFQEVELAQDRRCFRNVLSTCVCLQNHNGGHVAVYTYSRNNTQQRNYSAGDRIYFPIIMGVPEIGYQKGLSAV